MVNLKLPNLEALHPIPEAGKLPSNRQRRYQATEKWPMFKIPNSVFLRLDEELKSAKTDFFEDPEDGRIFVLTYARQGCAIATIAPWMREKVEARRLTPKAQLSAQTTEMAVNA